MEKSLSEREFMKERESDREAVTGRERNSE